MKEKNKKNKETLMDKNCYNKINRKEEEKGINEIKIIYEINK